MKQASNKRSRKRLHGAPPGRQRALGGLLGDLRAAKGLSLREVEVATDRRVSNAYLSQLEKGKIQQPSPSVLHHLAAVFAVPYEALMERAGYLIPPSDGASKGRRKRLAAFAIDDLTAEEEEQLLEYLAFIRSRRR